MEIHRKLWIWFMRNRSLVFTCRRFLLVFVVVMMVVINKDLDASSNNFKVDGTSIVDLATGKTLFLKGIGYSPFFPKETPVWEANLPNDTRYANHLNMIKDLNANFLL